MSNELNENKDATWKVLSGNIDGNKTTIRVDTKYADVTFLHTYYVQQKYSWLKTKALPKPSFLEKFYALEDQVDKQVNETFQGQVAFLGTAIWGGSGYLIYASDLSLRWEEYISEKIGSKVKAGAYLDDHMGYYDKILYPKNLRH